jgi:uncharacterized protein
MAAIAQQIAQELSVAPHQVDAAIKLLDEGSTVPFIARYRKEVTGGLDDTQLRNLDSRLAYLRELSDRRSAVLKSIEEQGKLTDTLKKQILEADSKTRLEDLYLPYKPKRRTKGQMAIEAGILPLAEQLLADPTLTPETLASDYINADAGYGDEKAVLDGAKYILMERFAEDAELIASARLLLSQQAYVKSTVMLGKEEEGQKFRDYFESSEALGQVPSHRALAMLRGRNEGILQLALEIPDIEGEGHPVEHLIRSRFELKPQGRAADPWLQGVVAWTWRVKLNLSLENELIGQLRERAETDAITVFSRNLHDLLMAAPAGAKATLGLDPGIRTGVKLAVVDTTGKLVATDTIYPHAPRNQWDQSIATLAKYCKDYHVALVSVGNGTASRETDRLVADMEKRHPDLKVQRVVVSEAGASVYSASELAANEFPDLDVSIRGAVSIARRLQDPLAELVKIDPKSIGVGQYQHDVSQLALSRKLDNVVEDCVNAVGVDVNMASAPLLTRVSGLTKTLAQAIVDHRDTNGAFTKRSELKKVARLGPKAFEQSAGFLRIVGGKDPLDASSVHPEAYPVVKRILAETGLKIEQLLGNSDRLKTIDPKQFTDETFGLPTVKDILSELEKPGRDPRPEFKTAKFKEGVETLKDLKPDMRLEGVVTNVTNFGAFVDIGVHQDGLVHISSLANHFVKDPHDVVKAGDLVTVKVLEVDLPRKRIALTMRLDESAAQNNEQPPKQAERLNQGRANRGGQGNGAAPNAAPANNAFADAFANAKRR